MKITKVEGDSEVDYILALNNALETASEPEAASLRMLKDIERLMSKTLRKEIERDMASAMSGFCGMTLNIINHNFVRCCCETEKEATEVLDALREGFDLYFEVTIRDISKLINP